MKKFDIISGKWKEPQPKWHPEFDMIKVGDLITWVDYAQCENTHHLITSEHFGMIKDITSDGVTIIDFIDREEKRFSVYSVLDFIRKKNKKYNLMDAER